MLDILTAAVGQEAAPAFDTSDLLLLRGLAEFHGLSMGIELAHQVGDMPCEEVVSLATPDGSSSWALWRDQDGIRLQSRFGAARRFTSICGVMAAVMPPAAEVLTDIHPTVW